MTQAQRGCNDLGGHLVSWKGLIEQVEVEQYYVNYGVLLPYFHKGYWTGLTADSWPNFMWVDKTAGEVDYTHWGTNEPKSMSNLCGIGNHTAEYEGAWGWADASCTARYPYICKMMGPRNLTLTSNVTGNTFTLYTTQATQAEAETACREEGGHLASFGSYDEQVEMEFAFMNRGYLLPGFHKSYWMGLNSSDAAWPTFNWLDRTLPNPSEDNYLHWGDLRTATGARLPEPNNQDVNEFCAVANYSEAFSSPPAWGWADASCSMRFIFMCKTNGEWGRRAAELPVVHRPGQLHASPLI